MRREEFAASCNVLGVASSELLDYEDGQLEFAEFSRAAGRIVRKIRAFQPDVVLTFGLDGGLNTHPDHTVVSAWTTAAFHWAGKAKRYLEEGAPYQAERLFHVTTSFFMEGRPAPMPAPWSVALDVRAVMGTKQEAFRQHTSQRPLMEGTRAMFEEFGEYEHYTLMAQREPGEAVAATSLFEGLGS